MTENGELRTVDEIEDSQFQEVKIVKVIKLEGMYEIKREDGWYNSIDDVGIEPKPGSVIRTYGMGIGHAIRGIAIDGKIVFYKTEEQQRVEDEAELEREKREKMKEFPSYDYRYSNLPPVFRERIDIFRENNSEFRWKYEAYELFCCEQAVIIANELESLREKYSDEIAIELQSTSCSSISEAVINVFQKLPSEERKKAIPELSDLHSGNTFDVAYTLALIYNENPENVKKFHGAMCYLVGCKKYGCQYGHNRDEENGS